MAPRVADGRGRMEQGDQGSGGAGRIRAPGVGGGEIRAPGVGGGGIQSPGSGSDGILAPSSRTRRDPSMWGFHGRVGRHGRDALLRGGHRGRSVAVRGRKSGEGSGVFRFGSPGIDPGEIVPDSEEEEGYEIVPDSEEEEGYDDVPDSKEDGCYADVLSKLFLAPVYSVD